MAENNFDNLYIAQLLNDIATAYIIKKKNIFRIKAYQDTSDSIVNYPQSLHLLWKKDKKLLDDIPGIGPAILEKIDYLFSQKKLHPHILQAFKNIHPAVFAFTKISGIGPKNAQKLCQKLKFPQNPQSALKKLIYYAQNHKIEKIPGFGKKSQDLISKNTQNYLDKHHRLSYQTAQKIAQKIIRHLKTKFPQTKFYPLGSLRRHNSTVGDIDIATKSPKNQAIIKHFLAFPQKIQTIYHGKKKASLLLPNNVQIDLMIQPAQTFGSLLQHFTGSKQHNILLRKYAQKLGYSLSEYGIKNIKTGKISHFSTEKSFYHFLHLCFIKPQDRLGENEIKLAQKCYTKNNH